MLTIRRDGNVKPGIQAKAREVEGWHGVCASDHLRVGTTRDTYVFVAASQIACPTSKIKITTSFCNNLFRSPVEFAQAALAISPVALRIVTPLVDSARLRKA